MIETNTNRLYLLQCCNMSALMQKSLQRCFASHFTVYLCSNPSSRVCLIPVRLKSKYSKQRKADEGVIESSRLFQKVSNKFSVNGHFKNVGQSTSSGTKVKTVRITAGSKRRADQIGIILFDYIEQAFRHELFDRSKTKMVTITKVEVSADFGTVVVQWMPKSLEFIHQRKILSNYLEEISESLRHYLHELHVISQIPPVVFKEDKAMIRVQNIEHLFQVADFGPVSEDSRSGESVHTSAKFDKLEQRFSNSRNTDNLDESLKNTENSVEDGLIDLRSRFRQDICYVNHSALMDKLINRRVKSKPQRHRFDTENTDNWEEDTNNQQDFFQPSARLPEAARVKSIEQYLHGMKGKKKKKIKKPRHMTCTIDDL